MIENKKLLDLKSGIDEIEKVALIAESYRWSRKLVCIELENRTLDLDL